MKRTITEISSLLLSTTLASLFTTTAAISISIKDQTCNGLTFTHPKVSVTCNDANDNKDNEDGERTSDSSSSSSCNFGDAASITGTITAIQAFDDVSLTIEPCIAGVCSKNYAYKAGNICDFLEPSSENVDNNGDGDNGMECGDPRDYIISHREKIAKEEKFPSGSGFMLSMLNVKVILTNAVEEGEECNIQKSYLSSVGTTIADPSFWGLMAGMAGVVVAVGVGVYGKRMYDDMKRRKREAAMESDTAGFVAMEGV
ncbi:hypothetical protein ACHAXS_007515 [Conticribra weissflogii]